MLDDFDVIGFDVEHSLVKFNVRELSKLFITEHLKALVPLGYPQEICEFDFVYLSLFTYLCRPGPSPHLRVYAAVFAPTAC